MGVGMLGTVIPMIPGLPMIFAGAWLAAFIDHYDKINVWVVVLLGVLMLIGLAVDWIAQTMGAKKSRSDQARDCRFPDRHFCRYLYRTLGFDFYAAPRSGDRRVY